MSREAAIFVLVSDEDQTIKQLILKHKEQIMSLIRFHQHVNELKEMSDFEDTPNEYFDKVFLDYDTCYTEYDPDYKKIFDVKKAESLIVILTVNSAGCWEGLQPIPLIYGRGTMRYYTKLRTIHMPS